MSHDLNNDPIFLSILEDIKADRLGNFLYNGSESPRFYQAVGMEFARRGGDPAIPRTAIGDALAQPLWEWWLEKRRGAAG
jgi:hypothetical protein